MHTRSAFLALALVATLPAFAAQPRSAPQPSPWTQTAPGVYTKTRSDGVRWEMHVGAEGGRIDRDRIARDIWSLQVRLATTRDAARKATIRRQIAGLQPLLTLAQNAARMPSAKAGTPQPELLAVGGTASLIPGHAYNYHDQATSKLCGFSVTQNADMATDAYPGYDLGFAQASVSWAPDKLRPTGYTLNIGGYARVGNDLGTWQTTLGPVLAGARTTGSASSPVATNSGYSFGCTLETFSQVAGPAACPTYVSFSRTKGCFDLWL